jgi:elongation factor Ts
LQRCSFLFKKIDNLKNTLKMTITAKEVNELRQMTGAGMMDCKKALTEANGDFEKAIELLRKKGQKVSASRQDRSTSEGVVFVKVSEAGNEGFAFSLQCETDFVAKNDDFQALGNKIADVVSKSAVNSVDEILSLNLDGQKIADVLVENMGKIGEKLEIGNFAKVKGDKVIPYIHSGAKLGVLVAVNGGSNPEVVGKDVAMQIAAMNPIAIDQSGVSQEIIAKEKEIGREQALAEGKPENMVDKIAEGKVMKFLKESTLLGQPFVKDSSKTVENYLKENGNSQIADFKRISIG